MMEHTCETSRTLLIRENTEKIERSSENCCDRLELACSRQLAMRVPPVSLSPWDRIFHDDMQIHFIVPLSGVAGSLERVAERVLNCAIFFFQKTGRQRKNIRI